MAKGVVCLFKALNTQANRQDFSLMDRTAMLEFFRKNGITDRQLDYLMEDMNALFKAKAKEMQGRNLSQKDKAIIDVFYGTGVPLGQQNGQTYTAALQPAQRKAFEAYANAFGLPFITEQEMKDLEALAKLASARSGQERAVVEEEIRYRLDQKDPKYFTRLQSAKVAFKVLLSVGFNVMSSISNRKKYWEALLETRWRFATKGTDGTFLGRFTSPYVLKGWEDINKLHAQQVARGVRGATGEGLQKWLTGLGWSDTTVLHGPSSVYGADVSASADALEYTNAREGGGLIGNMRKLDRKLARASKRWAASVDAAGKVRIGELGYFNQRFAKMRKQFPNESDKEIIRRVTKEMYAVPRDEAERKAEEEFLQWNIELRDVNGVPTVNKRSARYLVRVAEIMKSGRKEAFEKQAYNRASVALWQGRADFWRGSFQEKVDSGVGGMIGGAISMLKNKIDVAIESIPEEVMGTTTKAFTQNVIFNIFGFINGPANFFEDVMEHFFVYAAVKGMTLKRISKSRKLTNEEREIVEDKIIELWSKTVFATVEAAMALAVIALLRGLCKNDSQDPLGMFSGAKPEGKQEGRQALPLTQAPENAFNACGVSLPIEWLGGFSLGSMRFLGAIYDAMQNKERDFGEALLFGFGAVAEGGAFSVFSDAGPGLIMKIVQDWDRKGEGESAYNAFFGTLATTLSRSAGNILVHMLPVPQRLLKEPLQATVIPYRTYSRAGNPNSAEGMIDFFGQFGMQTMYNFANASGVNTIAQMFTNTDGLIGRPLFDIRGRLIDAGNMYDGRGIAGMSMPLRQLLKLVEGKDPNLYDELDHHLVMNKVAPSWEGRHRINIFKDDDAKVRMLTDDEYYNFHYAANKILGERLQDAWDRGELAATTKEEKKALQKLVPDMQGEIRSDILRLIEEYSDRGEDLPDPHEFYEIAK